VELCLTAREDNSANLPRDCVQRFRHLLKMHVDGELDRSGSGPPSTHESSERKLRTCLTSTTYGGKWSAKRRVSVYPLILDVISCDSLPNIFINPI
jgi:hypothetical protein